uniref:Uncharacterized protein n=1 Tax=viral metagenome TaxID=1070528 RepID=A0A6M3K9V8_9ZZZZ
MDNREQFTDYFNSLCQCVGYRKAMSLYAYFTGAALVSMDKHEFEVCFNIAKKLMNEEQKPKGGIEK